jgi:chaperonin cofactor prefoldin
MIKSEKNKLVTDLEEKSKLMKSRVESVENQEKILEKNASDLRAAVSNIGPEKK